MIAATIALIVLLMLGGSSGGAWASDLKGALKDHVPDKDRREAVLAESEALEDGMKDVGKALQGHFGELLDAHLDYGSTATDFEAITLKLKQDQFKAFALDLDVRSRIRDELSEEEWTVVFSDGEK